MLTTNERSPPGFVVNNPRRLDWDSFLSGESPTFPRLFLVQNVVQLVHDALEMFKTEDPSADEIVCFCLRIRIKLTTANAKRQSLTFASFFFLQATDWLFLAAPGRGPGLLPVLRELEAARS